MASKQSRIIIVRADVNKQETGRFDTVGLAESAAEALSNSAAVLFVEVYNSMGTHICTARGGFLFPR
jgi:hypothetical protein